MRNGTAANVVAMVFGSMRNGSGTAVGITGDPATGQDVLFGEYSVNVQGEDMVAGIRTPKPLQDADVSESRDASGSKSYAG